MLLIINVNIIINIILIITFLKIHPIIKLALCMRKKHFQDCESRILTKYSSKNLVSVSICRNCYCIQCNLCAACAITNLSAIILPISAVRYAALATCTIKLPSPNIRKPVSSSYFRRKKSVRCEIVATSNLSIITK